MAQEVESSALNRLLELQEHDSAIARLNHRKEGLPEAQRLSELNAQLAELQADLEIARKQAAEIGREQDRIEGEIQLLEQKTEREEQRLFSGAVSNPKELGALQAEVAMLKNKRGQLDDSLLEVMVQKDDAAATVDRLEGEEEVAAREAEELTKVVGAITAEIDGELQSHSGQRVQVSASIPDDLLRLYESLRDAKAGVGAAALVGDTCQGCHTKLPSKEVERVRNEGGIQRCDNCRRILVVT